MQKKNVYCFSLSHTTKTKIYIRRFEIPKKLVHSGALALMLSFGLTTAGVAGFVESPVVAQGLAPVGTETVLSFAPERGPRQINYGRPETATEFAANSGGPAADLQLTEEEIKDAENGEVDAMVKVIAANSDPATVPSIWSHLGKINNEFGFRRNPFGGRSYEFHAGMDIDGEKGDAIIAPANGKVIKAGWAGGYGNMIEIDHGNGLTTRYGHLSKIEVQAGDVVTRGQLIGLLGSTGRSTGPHLHYELRVNEKTVNPRLLLPPEPTEIKQ